MNNVTKLESFPMPQMEDCVDSVGSASHVSKLNVLKSVWQVPLTTCPQEISSAVNQLKHLLINHIFVSEINCD